MGNAMRPFLAAFGLLLLLGCGGTKEPRQALFGKVLRGGQPVAAGVITLYPAAGTDGPTAMTEITGGGYRFTTESGPYPGAHKVAIDFQIDPPLGKMPAGDAIKEARSPTAAAGAPATEVPPRFETTFTVPTSGDLHKDFELAP